MSIKINKLTHNYSSLENGEISALKNINLSINEGEFVGIIGQTGSGKTTFVQHLNGLLQSNIGSVEIDGIRVSEDKKALKQIRKKVGIVFQYPEAQLFEETVYKDISFGPKNMGLDDKEIDLRVRKAMELVHLNFDKYADKSPFELSGGQMRRVAIAGVIAMNPKYLVLDEPTAGLDPHGRERILSMIEKLHKEENTTIIMVTHNMDEISRLASRIIVFNKGSVVQDGSPKEIFMKGDVLQTVGLHVPQVMTLATKLKENGFEIDDNIYKMDDMKAALLKLFRSKNA